MRTKQLKRVSGLEAGSSSVPPSGARGEVLYRTGRGAAPLRRVDRRGRRQERRGAYTVAAAAGAAGALQPVGRCRGARGRGPRARGRAWPLELTPARTGAGVARRGDCKARGLQLRATAACAYTATASACIGAVRRGAARSRHDLATISPRSRHDLATISHRGISPRPPASSVAEYTRAPPGSTSPSASPLPMAAPGQGDG